MSDNILSAVLTFSLMAGGTVAIGSEMLDSHPAAPTTSVTLAPVTIIGHRAGAVALVAADVTLATVTIVGHRDIRTDVAADAHGAAPMIE